MKSQIAYKVVSRVSKGVYSSCVINRGPFCVTYRMGKRSKARSIMQQRDRHLLVFSKFFYAKQFLQNRTQEGRSMVVLKVRVGRFLNPPSFCDAYNLREGFLKVEAWMGWPADTRMVKQVTPLKEIRIRQ